MTAFRQLAAALTFAAAASGCTPAPGGATKPTTPDGPVADLSPAQVRALAAETAPPLRPALLNAADTRDHERRLVAVWAGRRPELGRTRPAPGWDGPAAALADLRAAAKVLRDTVGEALRTHDEFAAVAVRYRADLVRGPPALRQAADYYRGKAAETPEQVLRDQYARLADNCLAHADLVRDREAEFARFRADADEAAEFTRRVHEYLGDFAAYAAFAPAGDGADPRRSYRDSLTGTVKGFAAFVAVHDRYGDAVRSRPLPARPGDPVPPAPGAPAGPYPGGSEHLVVFRSAVPDPAARSEAAAARFGVEYVRARAAGMAELRRLNARLAECAGRPPPALRADSDAYLGRSRFINGLRPQYRVVDGGIDTGGRPLPPGTHLAVISLDCRGFAAVIRVGHGRRHPSRHGGRPGRPRPPRRPPGPQSPSDTVPDTTARRADRE